MACASRSSGRPLHASAHADLWSSDGEPRGGGRRRYIWRALSGALLRGACVVSRDQASFCDSRKEQCRGIRPEPRSSNAERRLGVDSRPRTP